MGSETVNRRSFRPASNKAGVACVQWTGSTDFLMRFLPTIVLVLAFTGTACKPKPAAPVAVAVAKTVRPPTQVVVAEVKRETVSEKLALVGTFAADEQVEIKAEIEGVVQEINFEEGQPVEAGRMLFKLDESKLFLAIKEAESGFKLAQVNHTRAAQLLKEKLIPQAEFDQAAAQFEASRVVLELRNRHLKDARIHAPFDGVMSARNVSVGQVIARNTALVTLVKLDPVRVELSVPERYLGQLKLGQTIEVNVAAFPGYKFTGTVFFIGPQVDPSTRTAMVKARLPNPKRELLPGMLAQVELILAMRENAIVIPETAIGQNFGDNQASLFVVDSNQTVQPRKVRLGVRLPGKVEVLSGVAAGEQVVVEGLQKIAPGSKVKVASPNDEKRSARP